MSCRRSRVLVVIVPIPSPAHTCSLHTVHDPSRASRSSVDDATIRPTPWMFVRAVVVEHRRDQLAGRDFALDGVNLQDAPRDPAPAITVSSVAKSGAVRGEASAAALDYSRHRADAHPKSEPTGSGRGTRSRPPSVVTASSNRTSTGKEARVGLAPCPILDVCCRPIGRSRTLG